MVTCGQHLLSETVFVAEERKRLIYEIEKNGKLLKTIDVRIEYDEADLSYEFYVGCVLNGSIGNVSRKGHHILLTNRRDSVVWASMCDF